MNTTNSTASPSAEKNESSKRTINVGRVERNASMVSGAVLAMSGISKLKQKKVLPGLAMVAAASMFLYRGKTGHCDMYQAIGVDTAGSEDTGLTIEKVMTINRPPQDVYKFWRNFENLPKFMQHLEMVQSTGNSTSHWKAKGPGNLTVEWDAEMLEDNPGQRISWRSIKDAKIPNEGNVEFHEAPAGRGTELKVKIQYYPPGGVAGKIAAQVVHGLNAQQIEDDLRRLKQILETGETATAERVAKSETSH